MNADIERKRSAALGWLKARGSHWSQRSRRDLSWTAVDTCVADTIAHERARLDGGKRDRLKAVKP